MVQRCMCGLHRPVEYTDSGMSITKVVVRKVDLVLPQKGTKYRRCLIAVADAYPGEINTAGVVRDSGLSAKETSAMLSVLLARGLLERTAVGRGGAPGGSKWRLTVGAKQLLQR